MRAKNLINSISSILNEDLYAKYSIKQLYGKLGPEEFADYLKKICDKILKGIDILKNIKSHSTDTGAGDVSILFDNKHEEYENEIWIQYIVKYNELFIACSVYSNSFNEKEDSERLSGNLTNIVNYVEDAIIKVVYSKKLVEYRKQLIREYEDGES